MRGPFIVNPQIRDRQLFLRLLADERLDLAPFDPVEVPFDHAPDDYAQTLGDNSPLTGILRYPGVGA